jgi:hypothetical protein
VLLFGLYYTDGRGRSVCQGLEASAQLPFPFGGL